MAPPMRPLAAQAQLAARRAYTTQRPSPMALRAQWTPRPAHSHMARRQAIRQQSTAPTPKPARRFRLLRWTWRLSYLSALAAVGYVGYGIYETRNPADQPPPDPSKKTLVVLGE